MHKGFSLIELMVIIAIIGVFVGVAVPSYSSYMVKSRVGTALPIMKHYAQMGQEYYEAHGSFGTAEQLGLEIDTQVYNVSNPQSLNQYTSAQIVNVDATAQCYNNIRFTFDGGELGLSQSFDIQMVVRNVDGMFFTTCGIPWNEDSTSYASVLQYFPDSCRDQNVSTCTE